MKKKQPAKHKNLYILLAFLLITIALLITVSLYCYLIRYWTKKKIFQNVKKKLCINNINNINQNWVIKSKI